MFSPPAEERQTIAPKKEVPKELATLALFALCKVARLVTQPAVSSLPDPATRAPTLSLALKTTSAQLQKADHFSAVKNALLIV